MAHILMFGPIFRVMYTCDWCGAAEGRLFADTKTDMELCIECLHAIAKDIELSPDENGDNLTEVLAEYRGPQAQPTSKE